MLSAVTSRARCANPSATQARSTAAATCRDSSPSIACAASAAACAAARRRAKSPGKGSRWLRPNCWPDSGVECRSNAPVGTLLRS